MKTGAPIVELEGARLRVRSPMRMADAAQLSAAGARLLPVNGLVVDLADVAAADSSALAVLLHWRRLQQAAGAGWQVESVPAGLHSLASLYGVGEPLGFA